MTGQQQPIGGRSSNLGLHFRLIYLNKMSFFKFCYLVFLNMNVTYISIVGYIYINHAQLYIKYIYIYNKGRWLEWERNFVNRMIDPVCKDCALRM